MASGEWEKTKRFIELAITILEEQWPMTIRQLFYQMLCLPLDSKFDIGGFENDDKHYKLVSRMMTKAREDGRVPFKWITDRSRPTYQPNVWTDLGGYAASIKHGYRKDYWEMQPYHVEVWCEKDAIIGSIEEVTDELGVTTRVGRGFQSTTRVHEISAVFSVIQKPKVVFYLGDHDPSGRDIERDLRYRVALNSEAAFSLKRLAIFAADIEKFTLPPLRIKQQDTRAGTFLKRYSDKCVELDALPPEELRRRIREAVVSVMNMEKWDRAVAAEKAELASIETFIKAWPTATEAR